MVKLTILLFCGCGMASLVYYAWKATSFPHLSETDINGLVDLPYLAYDTSKQVSHLAAATRTYNVEDAATAEECIAHLNPLVTESAILTLAWHNHTIAVIDAIENEDFRTANTTIKAVLSSLANIEASTSAALTVCDLFFASLNREIYYVHIVNYRSNERDMEKGLNIIPHVRSLWGGSYHWGAAKYVILRLRWSAHAVDRPFRFAWRHMGLSTHLSRHAAIVQKLVEAHQTAYRARVGDALEQMQREIEGLHRDQHKKTFWTDAWLTWAGWVGTGGSTNIID